MYLYIFLKHLAIESENFCFNYCDFVSTIIVRFLRETQWRTLDLALVDHGRNRLSLEREGEWEG